MQLEFKILIYLITAFLHRSAAYIEDPEREENSLIPKALRPLDYSLLFDVPMASKKFLFLGTADIRLECVERTNEIILNMKDLMFDKGGVHVAKEVGDSDLQPINISEPILENGKQWLIITLNEELEVKEKIQVKIKYYKVHDTSQDPDVAFFKYRYARKAVDKYKWIAVSTSGADNGRKLYPCIDEPGVKTEFQVRVLCEDEFKCVSNAWTMNDQKNRNQAENSEIDSQPHYNTPPLSTFSIGLVVGDLKPQQHTDDLSGTEIRIWSDEAVIEQLNFAGKTALKIAKFYRQYFRSVLRAPKIDVVALPFYGSANKWIFNLIILEESLITTADPSTQIKEIEIAFLLCGVFCGQYFGPQTTFKTWSENWLSMGLALFYRIPCIEKIFPFEETGIVNRHLVESFIRVSSVNAEIKARPIMIPDSRIDLKNLFQDTELAEKAYFLVRMMSYFMGENVLSEQVKNYIAEFTFKVSSLDDLWAKFPFREKNSKLLSKDVTFKAVMDSWTQKEGLAHVKMTRNKKEKFVTIQQEFSMNRSNHKIIPLSFVTKKESVQKSATKSRATKKSNDEGTIQFWLQSETVRIHVEKNDWVILNTRLNVLCRVQYDPITLKLLRKTLLNRNSYEIIDIMSRTKLISDLFASAEIGKLSYSILLKFIRYLKHEKSPFPIIVALHELKRIRIGLFGTEIFSKFQSYVQEILKAIIKRNKFDIKDISEDDYEQCYFKKLVFTSACTFQIKECVDLSKAHFAKLIESGDLSRKIDPIPGALRGPLYCQAIREGDDQEWDFLYLFYSSEHWESLNDIILKALACTTDSYKMNMYLERTLDPEKIAPEDRLLVYQSVASNENGFTSLKDFFRDNIEEISELNKNYRSHMRRYLEILYESAWTQDHFDELEDILEFNVPQAENIRMFLEDSKQITRKNILWLKNMKVEISEFFEAEKIGNRVKKALMLK